MDSVLDTKIAIRYERFAPDALHCWIGRVCLGDLVMGDDGFYMFFLDHNNGGGWSGWLLADLAKKIEELDEPNRSAVDEYFAHPLNQ